MRAAATARPTTPAAENPAPKRTRSEHTVAEHEPLTAAELRLLRFLPTHRTLISIGRELFVAHSTAKTHSLSIYRKLGVNSRAAAIERAIELGLLAPEAETSSTRATIVEAPRSLRVVPSGQPDRAGARRAHASA
jgi:DNA-binding CsgD family transcriptional regulator